VSRPSVSSEALRALLMELESVDPVDFGALPLAEDEARQLVCAAMAQLSRDLHGRGLSDQAIETMALAVAARTLIENLVLHHERLSRSDGEPLAVSDWLARLANRR
jgi:hypothetical protein